MPGGNLNKEIFLNTVKGDVANGTTNAVVCHAKRKKLTSKIQKIRQGKQHLGGLKLYLNGFIKPFNQTIKHCISIIDTKKASHALLCGVCTNHYNIDGNSLIAIFLYKIQFKY